MLGFAVIDSLPGGDMLAVWLTSRIHSQRAGHTNAVTINLATDPDIQKKILSLTGDRAVLITPGSTIGSIPIEDKPLTVDDIDVLVSETEKQQALIVAAVDSYTQKTGNKNLVPPEFPASPNIENFRPTENTAAQRALHTANYLARAWTTWLVTDEQRRRRSVQPRTNTTPWIMPEDLSSPDIAMFPTTFGERICAQPLVRTSC